MNKELELKESPSSWMLGAREVMDRDWTVRLVVAPIADAFNSAGVVLRIRCRSPLYEGKWNTFVNQTALNDVVQSAGFSRLLRKQMDSKLFADMIALLYQELAFEASQNSLGRLVQGFEDLYL